MGITHHDSLTLGGALAVTGAMTSAVDVGASAASLVTVAEYGDGVVHKTVITMASMVITVADSAGTGQYGSIKIYDMPVGVIAILGATLNSTITLVEANWTDTAEGDVAVGTIAVTNASDAMSGTEQDIIPTTAIPALTAQVGAMDAASTATELAAGVWDGTGGAKDVYLNVLIDDAAAHAAADTLTVTGTLTLVWINLGDM